MHIFTPTAPFVPGHHSITVKGLTAYCCSGFLRPENSSSQIFQNVVSYSQSDTSELIRLEFN